MNSLECNDLRPSIVITTERVKLRMHKNTQTQKTTTTEGTHDLST